MTVLEKFYQGDVRALSKVISFVENRKDGYQELLGKLYLKAGNAVRIGVTGPPGAGKSTLVNRILNKLVGIDKKIGVVAIDPTSPFSGGALLGDRVRMNEVPTGGNIYFRSMATRGASGGLASSTDNIAVVLDAFGFDYILIETVGVGQVELDIIDSCDTIVVAIVPESGDAVQTMKAGLMEIADIMVVNKADRPGSDNLIDELTYSLHLQNHQNIDWDIPIIPTIATKDENIDVLCDAIMEHYDFCNNNGQFELRRRKQIERKIQNIIKNRFYVEFSDQLSGKISFEGLIGEIINREKDPYEVSNDLYEQFKKL
ncbi:MAG: methylmalonyl Co-A mutase-associated GTPase MeaB [Candidatus Zixiibacteriota bacterium]|nr:MAG: methylmalonyl Co-A mutase-associated GTPase MeaB [candidate division Zixibacteria bacterium]